MRPPPAPALPVELLGRAGPWQLPLGGTLGWQGGAPPARTHTLCPEPLLRPLKGLWDFLQGTLAQPPALEDEAPRHCQASVA